LGWSTAAEQRPEAAASLAIRELPVADLPLVPSSVGRSSLETGCIAASWK
jgi:hypothetical protein